MVEVGVAEKELPQAQTITMGELSYSPFKAVSEGFMTILRDPMGAIGLVLLVMFILMGIFAPWLAPYEPFEVNYGPNRLSRLEAPSTKHWFGTNSQAQDVLSQVVYGARVALIVGSLSAIASAAIGTVMGLVSGYFGGWVDNVLMRITDIAYGIPFLPFALIFVSLAGPSIWNIIIVIAMFMWRTTSRVIRSQVLTLKERPFILAAKASGAGHLRLIFLHLGPNVLPFTFLYMALGIISGVMSEAGLSFLGFGDPLLPTWGQMLNTAFRAGAMRSAWWWILPPGLALTVFVTSTFFITRAYETMINPRLREV